MTQQFFALKFGSRIHILNNPGPERNRFTDGLTYHSGVSSLTPNFLLHLYTDSNEYSDREKNLAVYLAEAHLLAESYLASHTTNQDPDTES